MGTGLTLRPWQRAFLASALAPNIRTAVLSAPRGNGKTTLMGHVLARALTPDDPLFVSGAESVLIAGSIEQCRLTFRAARGLLGEGGDWRFLDSSTRCGITHRPSNTRLRVIGSNAKTTLGLVNCPLAILDECGSWEINGGQLMWSAVKTSMGKPASPLKAILVSTLAPFATGAGHWFYDLVHDGSNKSTHVAFYQCDPDAWDKWPALTKANPLMARFAESRETLLDERNKARGDTRLKAEFLSFRCNVPTADEAKTLLTVPDWKAILKRPVPEVNGTPPVVGVDLGQSRAWSSAVAVWPNGRTEAIALTGGVPTLEKQETRDRVPAGTYRKLHDEGLLIIDPDLEVPRPALLTEHIGLVWKPRYVLADLFRTKELRQVVPKGIRVVPRRPLWSHAAEDVRALRKMAKDGPLSVAHESRPLLKASLSVARVENDRAGSTRLVKNYANTARDDVCAAWLLAAGGVARMKPKKGKKAVACG